MATGRRRLKFLWILVLIATFVVAVLVAVLIIHQP